LNNGNRKRRQQVVIGTIIRSKRYHQVEKSARPVINKIRACLLISTLQMIGAVKE